MSFEYQARLIQKLTLGLESINWQDYKIHYHIRAVSVNLLLYDNDGGDNDYKENIIEKEKKNVTITYIL